jgi:hypothetical protein
MGECVSCQEIYISVVSGALVHEDVSAARTLDGNDPEKRLPDGGSPQNKFRLYEGGFTIIRRQMDIYF